jgi:hypothetical protein
MDKVRKLYKQIQITGFALEVSERSTSGRTCDSSRRRPLVRSTTSGRT